MVEDEVAQKIKGLSHMLSSPLDKLRNVDGNEKIVSKTVRIDLVTEGRLELVKEALGTRNDSDAIRWLMSKGWEIYGDRITHVAEKSRENRLE